MKKNIFKDQFDKLLTEDLEETPSKYDDLSDDPDQSQEAFEDTLDDETNPEDYDINPNDVRKIGRENIAEATKWVQILNDFADLINSVKDKDSLNNFLNRVDREGSAFRGIVRSQGKRTTRIAEEAAAMAQVIESHIIGYDKKERELLQQFPNLRT
jgi:superfamily I DNA and RNA helicase